MQKEATHLKAVDSSQSPSGESAAFSLPLLSSGYPDTNPRTIDSDLTPVLPRIPADSPFGDGRHGPDCLNGHAGPVWGRFSARWHTARPLAGILREIPAGTFLEAA